MPNRRTFLAAGIAALSARTLRLSADDGPGRGLQGAARGVGTVPRAERQTIPVASEGPIGIYALQSSIRFDNLQVVAFDAETQQLTLLGDRWTDLWKAPIPYLDHLAAALDSDNPSFTLPWDEDATRQVDALLQDAKNRNAELWDRIAKNARGELFNAKNRLTKEGLRILRTLNFPTDDYRALLTNKFDVIGRTFQICGGEQQATIVGSYGRSLRDPDALNEALSELAMSRALDASMTGLDTTDLWETFIERFAGVFDVDPKDALGVFRDRLQQGDHLILARNAGVEEIITDVESTWGQVFPDSLELSAADQPHIHLPPDLVRSLAGIEILVKPTWNRIEPTSRLAEVMFDADLLLKWIVSDPTLLSSDLPSHLTEYEWNQSQGDTAAKSTADTVRFWLSPDVIELTESADGAVLEFGSVTMRVNTDDPSAEPYANYLTSIYDDLAREFPTLHELRECAKLVTVAQWLQKRAPEFRLPAEGRDAWEPPQQILGFMTIDATVDVQRMDTDTESSIKGIWTSQVHFEGGVSLALGRTTRPDGTVLFDGARGPQYTLGNVTLLPSGAGTPVRVDDINRVVVPEIYDNQTLKNILRQSTIPPPPLPPGATGRATLGRRKLDYLNVLQQRVGERANADTVQTNMQEAVRLAKELEFLDEKLNGLQAGRIAALAAFQDAEEWARAERAQFLWDIFDIFIGSFATYVCDRAVVRFRINMTEVFVETGDRTLEQWFLVITEYLPKIKSVLADVKTAQESVTSHEHFERNLGYATRGVELLGEINSALGSLPESKVIKAIPGYTGLLADVIKCGFKIAAIQENLNEIDRLSTEAGAQARLISGLQKRRQAVLTRLQQVMQQLEPTAG